MEDGWVGGRCQRLRLPNGSVGCQIKTVGSHNSSVRRTALTKYLLRGAGSWLLLWGKNEEGRSIFVGDSLGWSGALDAVGGRIGCRCKAHCMQSVGALGAGGECTGCSRWGHWMQVGGALDTVGGGIGCKWGAHWMQVGGALHQGNKTLAAGNYLLRASDEKNYNNRKNQIR